jgi:hypothetical protein
MARHGGRDANTPPGPGTGAHPAAGTAPVPAEPAVTPTQAAAVTADAVIALANEVCGLYARAEVARAMAGHTASEAEHAHLSARAQYWDTLVNEQWAALAATITAALPSLAQVEPFMPVRPLTNGHVELHAHDTAAHRVVVLLSGAQALAVGAHLTAYAAISLDRIGQRLDPALPPVKAAPPFHPTATAEQAGSPEPPPARP